jgi:hypothetical protein
MLTVKLNLEHVIEFDFYLNDDETETEKSAFFLQKNSSRKKQWSFFPLRAEFYCLKHAFL